MKKSLLALAVLGAFAGAASAQSSVTLYGLIDMGVARINEGTSNGVLNGAPAKPGVNTVQQGASSRLGFRGVEDLGGGLKAGFWLEGAVANDTGAGNGGGAAGGSGREPFVSIVPSTRQNALEVLGCQRLS